MDREKLEFKSDISEIVKKSALNEEHKALLDKVFEAMADYEYNLLDKLEKIVRDEQDGLNYKTREQLLKNKEAEYPATKWDDDWDIKTILVSENDKGYYKNFNPVDENLSIYFADGSIDDDKGVNELSDKQYKHIFLDCPYDEIDGFCDKTYEGVLQRTGKPFSYQLTINRRFVEKEAFLAKIAKAYKIDRPLVFSPYARHAVDIRIDDTDAENISQFIDDKPDFKLSSNGLEGKLILNHLLMWNVEIKNVLEKQYGYASTERENSSICEISGEDSDKKICFAYPNVESGESFDVCKSASGVIKIYTPGDLENGYKMLTINKVQDRDIDTEIFANVFDGKSFIKLERLRTKRDIEDILKKFWMNGYSCHYLDKSAADRYKNVITRYPHELSYPQDKNELYYAESRRLPICKILFRGSEKLLADYANYVLYYLEQNYPEFCWAGVYE